MEEHRMEGSEDLPQWLVENGDNFDALLDEAKKEVRDKITQSFIRVVLNSSTVVPR